MNTPRHQARQIHFYKEVMGVLGMLRDPHAIQNIYRIEDGLLDAPASQWMLRHLRDQPGVADALQRRHLRNETPDLATLRELPVGSLGYEYAKHIDDYGFNAAYYQPLPVRDDLTYAVARIRETHDFWHVLTGFHPTPIGEIGLKAFELAQLHRPMAAVIVAGGLMRYLFVNPSYFANTLEAIKVGYDMGQRARPLLAVDFESRWATPVEELRRELRLASAVRRATPRALGKYDHDGVKPSRAA